VEFTPEMEVRELWTVDVGSLAGKFDARLAPVIDAKTIYVTNAKGLVHALAADSGRLLWETDTGMSVTGATGVGEGLIVVGTRKGEVVALDAGSGERRWSGKVSSEVQAPPAIGKGMVVVQTVDGKIVGLNANDGKPLWVFDRSEPALSLHGTSTPVVAADFVLAGFANGKIVALQLKDGKLLWEYTVAQPRGRNEIERLVDVDSSALLWGDTLFAVAYQGRGIAVDLRTGRELWTRDVSSYAGLDADRGAVFIADDKGRVLAFDQRAGASLWRQEKLRGRGLSAPVLHDKAVVVGDFEGYLHWLARDDGHFVARYRLDSAPIQIRGIGDGATLYVAAQSGRLSALQLIERR
jgi:outer membrane protein assembly factor BamB